MDKHEKLKKMARLLKRNQDKRLHGVDKENNQRLIDDLKKDLGEQSPPTK